MEVNNINSTQSFKGLNIKKVAHKHKKFIRANYGELKKLGEQYDITIKSSFGDEAYYNGLDITVRPLRKNVSFINQFNRPKGKSRFFTEYTHIESRKDKTVLGETLEAITDLRRNSLLRAFSLRFLHFFS